MRLIGLFKKEIAHEAQDWVDNGLISKNQADTILSKYNTSLSENANKMAFGYYLLMSLAALFIGLALILVVSHNWDEIPRFLRAAGMTLTTLTVGGIGIQLYINGKEKAGNIWLFFGTICYGASIMQIAQIYNLGEHFPDGIFWWACATIPLIILTQSRIHGFMSLSLSTIWMFVEVDTDFFPALYPLFIAIILWQVLFHKKSSLLFIGSIIGIAFWSQYLIAWLNGGLNDFIYLKEQLAIMIGMVLIVAGGSWRLIQNSNAVLNEYGMVCHLWLLRTSTVALLFLSFDGVWRSFFREFNNNNEALVISTLIIVLSGAWSCFIAKKSGMYALVPIALMTSYLVITALLIGTGNNYSVEGAILTNIVLISLGIFLIVRGIEQVETKNFYTGITILLLVSFLRYIDLIGDYIGGALLFSVAGVILIVSAKYWKKHQEKVKASMESKI